VEYILRGAAIFGDKTIFELRIIIVLHDLYIDLKILLYTPFKPWITPAKSDTGLQEVGLQEFWLLPSRLARAFISTPSSTASLDA
jgi:hypothetical protein